MTTGAESNIIASVIDTWRKFGIFDFILPFLLVFSIIYGILERTDLFGKKVGKSVNAIIAFTIAMTTTLTGWFIGFITGFLPWVSTISIIIITGLMLVAIFAKDFETLLKGKKGEKVLMYGAIIVVVSLGGVLLWLGSPIFELFNIDEVINAIGLSSSDIIGMGFFVAFIIALILIGRGGSDDDKPGSSGE